MQTKFFKPLPPFIALLFFLSGCGLREVQTTQNGRMEEDFSTETECAVVDNIPENTESVDNPTGDAETDETQISLVMVGDILLHTPVEESCEREDGSYDFTPLFSNVKEEIAAADLALVNEEVIIGGAELGVSGYPAFNAPYEIADALAQTGFDVILHGTNHAMDKGKQGILNCLSYWKTNYPQLAVLGINDSEEKRDTVYVYEQDGIKIAILNYTYGLNGIALPADMPYAVNLLDEERVVSDLLAAKEQADFVVVCPHWGTEYSLQTDAMQEKWTGIFLENGVDLVLGTHPHVIEPVEWYTEEESGHKMLVYNSLGNYVNWTSGTGEGVANRMVGGMAEVTVGKSPDGGVEITDYGVRALVCHVTPGTDGVTTYFLSDYTDELAAENAIVSQDANFSREYCVQLCDEVWGGLWE